MTLELNPYARFLDQRPVEDILTSTPMTLESLLQNIPPEQVTVSPAPGKWSAAEILCHLADCEIAFAFRLRQTLAHDPETGHHIMQPFDQDRWAATYKGIPAAGGPCNVLQLCAAGTSYWPGRPCPPAPIRR